MKQSTQPKHNGIVIYSGPSLLDGAPIVAIAVMPKSKANDKTGAMLQTYIIRSDMKPNDAVRSGLDAAVCGDCKHRPSTGGACYVQQRGPVSVYGAFTRGRYPLAHGDSAQISAIGAGRMVRLGSYGDPAAVPAAVWRDLLANAAGHTGYTHQWQRPIASELKGLCMASADTPEERTAARAAGWRTFTVRLATDALAQREFACPASAEMGKRTTCIECKACHGAARAGQASVAIIAHGALARRYIAIRSA